MAIELTDTEAKLSDLYKFDETAGAIDAADYADVESIVKADICTALEVRLRPDIDLSTPLGRLMEWLALHFTGVLGLNVQNANQLLVSAAAGQQLDAIAQWFQLKRKPSSYSTVKVDCYNGSDGDITIPQGSTVRNESGNYFESTSDTTIAAGETETILFEAVEEGPIGVAAGTVNIIGTPIMGWMSCTNKAAGELGSNIETDEELRERIIAARSVGPGFLQGIKNAVEAIVNGNGSVMALENNTGAPLEVHGVAMKPHSILVCVDGLEAPKEGYEESDEADKKVLDVAKAIFNNKPCGTGYTLASQSKSYPETANPGVDTNPDGSPIVKNSEVQYDVPVTDAFGNTYHVFFCAPIPQKINVYIEAKSRGYTGANMEEDIKNAVSVWANNANFKCGESIYASDIIKAVESAVSGIIVIECKVSDCGIEKGTSYLEIDAIHKAELGITDVVPK